MTRQTDRQVEVPINKLTLLEFVGLVFDTGVIHEDELEGEHRTALNKIDRYFYETISTAFGNNVRPHIPFK